MSPVIEYKWCSGVRQPAVAGTFYPADPHTLRQTIDGLLREARQRTGTHARPSTDSGTAAAPTSASAGGEGSVWPKAIIAPHAGYIYSGPIAASAFALLAPARGKIRRVVLIGPAHRVPVPGLATSSARAFATPLGEVPLDGIAINQVLALSFVQASDRAHAPEHCLEVQLPFLQEVLGSFALVPLVFGQATPDQAAQTLELLWGGPETLIVISSDLSHYHGYQAAKALDEQAAQAIEALAPQRLAEDQACGRIAIQGLLIAASRHGLMPRTVDLRNSGDTAGPRDGVVGYGAWVFLPPPPRGASPSPVAPPDPSQAVLCGPPLGTAERATLLKISAESIAYGLKHRQPLPIDLSTYPAPLQAIRATFVTLHIGGNLRGCIGTLEATRPLAADVAYNAYAAAFSDPRFAPLNEDEAPGLDIHISILNPPEPMAFTSQEDLLRQVRPGIDGLILEECAAAPAMESQDPYYPSDGSGSSGGRGRARRRGRGTFLPAVWESLPRPADFLTHLKIKAGLPADYWSDTIRVWRYTAESVH